MILEYFQMVDRIESLDAAAGTIRTTCDDAQRRARSSSATFRALPASPAL